MKRQRCQHLTDREVGEFLAGRLKPAATQHAVVHVIDGCAGCSDRICTAAMAGRYWGVREPESAYDACLDRAEAALPNLLAHWGEEAKSQLEGAEMVRRKGWGNLSAFQRNRFRDRWAEVEILLALSFGARFRDRLGMLHMAQSAVRKAKRLEASEEYPEALLFDLRARAVAELGNAQRVNERFFQAEEALKEAWELQEKGTGDRLVEARIAEVEASLRRDQPHPRLKEAQWLLDEAYRLYLGAGQRHLAGRALMKKGITQRRAEAAGEAVETLRRTVALLDPEREPQLLAIAHHNLILALVDAGELAEASRLLMKGDLRRAFQGDPLNLLRYRWLEGKLLAARNRFENARAALTEVRDGFRLEGLEYVAAIAGIDIGKLYLKQSRSREAYEVAQELHARARSKQVPVGAQQALRCWEIVCREGFGTPQFAGVIQRFLEEAEHRPQMTFEPELLIAGG